METRVSAPAGSAATCWIGTVSGTFWKWRAPSAPAPPRAQAGRGAHDSVAPHPRAGGGTGHAAVRESRGAGFVLTEDGQRLFVHAEQMESAVHSARENLSGIGQALSGHLRIGATEGFGSYVLTPLAADFQRRYPHITLDILPVPRFVSLSKREADLAITIERPQRGPMSAASCATTRCGCTARPAIWRAIRPSAHRQTWRTTRSSAMWTNCCSASDCAIWRICCQPAR